MKCRQILRRLSACQDGEASPELRLQVEEHLRGCAGCRREWESLLDLERRLRLLPQPASDPSFAARVMSGLRREPVRLPRLAQAVAMAAAFAAAFAGGLLLQREAFGGAAGGRPQPASFLSVLEEPQTLALLAVQDDTLRLFAGDRP